MNGLLSATSLLPYIVGYQNKGFENSGYSIVANTFEGIGIERDAMTLGDIKVNEDFIASKLVFMTTGGATARTTFGGKTVAKEYVYWFAEDDPEDGEGTVQPDGQPRIVQAEGNVRPEERAQRDGDLPAELDEGRQGELVVGKS